MEVDKSIEGTSLGNEEVEKVLSEAIGDVLDQEESKAVAAKQEAQEAVAETLTKFLEEKKTQEESVIVKDLHSQPYKKLDELSEDELKLIEARLAERLDNWADDDDDEAIEEVLKSFLLLSQMGAATLLALCSVIPRTHEVAGSWYLGIFISLLLLVSGLFVKKIYWQWAPFCSLMLTLALSFYFVGRIVYFYHKDGFLSFLSIFFSCLIGLSSLVILWRIYKNKSMEL